jgi:hypothetical protein
MEARVRRGVRVAEQSWLIAQPSRRERHIVVACIQRRAVAADAIVHLVEACVDAGSRRGAGSCAREVAGEHHALGGQSIGVGRLDCRMSGSRQAVAPPLVACYEQNVGTLERFRLHDGFSQMRSPPSNRNRSTTQGARAPVNNQCRIVHFSSTMHSRSVVFR